MSIHRFMRIAASFIFAVSWVPTAIALEDHVPTLQSRLGAASVAQGPTSLKDLTGIVAAVPPPRGAANVLRAIRPDPVNTLRGVQSIQLYRKVSPSVVLVITETGLGSGTLIEPTGEILTNWHVVGDATRVGVVFKPVQEGQAITEKDLRFAEVVRVDEVADLALVRVESVPAGVHPVSLGDEAAIAVGADVHAIGHPTGETWTYTMGVISQVRQDYTWTTEDRREHVANVVQTQTPINPGNSGGPLLTDEGRLIGVNSFKMAGESLNFAVAVSDIRRFLASTASRKSAPASNAPECEVKELYAGKREKEGYEVAGIDVDCDGEVDMEFRLPFKKSEPLMAALDRNQDGVMDMVVFSESRDLQKWDMSFVDDDFDGKWDLVGYHENGEITATRFEQYEAAVASGKGKKGPRGAPKTKPASQKKST